MYDDEGGARGYGKRNGGTGWTREQRTILALTAAAALMTGIAGGLYIGGGGQPGPGSGTAPGSGAPERGSSAPYRAAEPAPSERLMREEGRGVPGEALAEYDDDGNGRITCAEARRHGIAPVREGHPAYAHMRDGNSDGVVC